MSIINSIVSSSFTVKGITISFTKSQLYDSVQQAFEGSTCMYNKITIYFNLFNLFSFSAVGRGDTATGFPNYSRPFVVEELSIHNTGISLLLSTSVWDLLSPSIECRD